MSLPQTTSVVAEAVTPYRTLVVEGHEGVHRARLFSELALLGFPLRQPPGGLDHLDPARPYRDLLDEPGRLVIDGGVIGELVYGPLRRGRSRVTWIQALDFAEAVAEREGAMLHLTACEHVVEHGDEPDGRHGDDGSETAAASHAYARVFRTLAQHVPVVSVNVTSATTHLVAGRTRRIRSPAPH
ncbi:hypothetical protein [Streptomyces sp. SID12488]|uniref:hypothetical protein n=1 Tax=Streptomyces sp. SID12488 TaxID=2706040 RepID=UPI0013D9C607|nr:hypothetical protein [Streptomyces sp. SID12488]NEA68240.1 hypothetical protein [Streptomyces sp. SID12488]